ncbi:hypothetical protein SEA_DOGFISH_48 [Gordonia phage Dogfish]|nr:hypothetical protein SEA_DOGFISH_48 [Gordonia phage Dogfish]
MCANGVQNAKMHRERGEKPCELCADAHRRSEQARAIRAGRRPRVTIRTGLLAWLYLTAPVEVQRRVEAELGDNVCDALVDAFDRQALTA